MSLRKLGVRFVPKICETNTRILPSDCNYVIHYMPSEGSYINLKYEKW